MISAIDGGVICLSSLVGPLPQLPQAVHKGHRCKVLREQLVDRTAHTVPDGTNRSAEQACCCRGGREGVIEWTDTQGPYAGNFRGRWQDRRPWQR